MTRFYIDTEFVDTGSTIELISIGIACEDGRELYLQSVEFDPSKANDWVKENVLPHLTLCPQAMLTVNSKYPHINEMRYHKKYGQCTFEDSKNGIIGAHADCPWRTRLQIKHEVAAFINVGHEYLIDNGNPEFIGWCSSYDHVALCQLFGTMMDIPSNFPHYIKDFQYILDERDISDDQLPEQESGLHHALEDARHLKQLWGYIVRNDAWQ